MPYFLCQAGSHGGQEAISTARVISLKTRANRVIFVDITTGPSVFNIVDPQALPLAISSASEFKNAAIDSQTWAGPAWPGAI
jgi:hypothetical protein